MLKRTLIALALTFALMVSVQPQSVHSVLMTETELAMLDAMDAMDAAATEHDTKQKSGGNSFVRALKAPFKALARLFGGGKKNEDRLQRLSEKDLKDFESTPADPVKTSRAAKTKDREKLSDNLDLRTLDHLARGRALLDSGSLNDAIEELSLATSINPTSAEAHNLLGIAYEEKGLRGRALMSFELAVQTNKDEPEYLNNLGYLLFKNGEFENATKYLKRAVKRAPDNSRIWNNLGLAQSERGHFDDAYKSFARALGEYKGHLNIAMRLEGQGETKDAIKHLEKAYALKPNSIEVLARLVPLYESAGKQDQAQSARSSLMVLRTVADAATN